MCNYLPCIGVAGHYYENTLNLAACLNFVPGNGYQAGWHFGLPAKNYYSLQPKIRNGI